MIRRSLSGILLAAALAATLVASCHKDACVPGDQQSCACLGGVTGVHVCRDDGSAWMACVCDPGTTSATTTTGTTTSTTTGTGAGGSGGNGGMSPTFPCSPPAGCVAVDHECIGLVKNAGKPKSGLRIAQLDLTAPQALSVGLIHSVIGGAIAPNLPSCNVPGGETVSWLLQFDPGAGTLKFGGAKPVNDPSAGYTFVNEQIGTAGGVVQVAPVTYSASVGADGTFSAPIGQDLFLPIYLDPSAINVQILPLHRVRFPAGTLSPSHDCIGRYNAAGLDPANACLPDDAHPSFLPGGTIDGTLTLEDADGFIVGTLNQTLCVLLSGNPGMYGTPAPGGVKVCTRDASNQILFHGDWCDALDQPATGGCFDAVHVQGNYAASSVLITN